MPNDSGPDQAQQAGSTAIGLEARANLCAVALDANSMSEGLPDLRKIEGLASRLKPIGLPLWIPEPVAWEWAEHISRQWQEFATSWSAASKRMNAAGLDVRPLTPHKDREEVQATVLESIGSIDNVVVVPLSAESARQGLRDQILLQSPGRRKSDIKTGASDSAWLRDLRSAAGGDLSRVLLVTSDGDVEDACRKWAVEPPLQRPWRKLLETLFSFTLDDAGGTVTRLIVSYLRARVGQADPGADCGFTVIGDSFQLAKLAEEHLDHPYEAPVVSVELTQLTSLAGVHQVTVQEPEGDPVPPARAAAQPVTHTALATVFFLGTVVYQYLDDDRLYSVTLDGALVRAKMAFQVQDGGLVVGAETVADAAVHFSPWHDDPDAALAAVCQALSVVPQLDFPEEWPESEASVKVTGPGGAEVYAELSRSQDTWTLTIWVNDDDHVELSCDSDPDEYRFTSAGDMDEHPYVLRVDPGSLSPAEPAWSLAAWLIERLFPAPDAQAE